MFRHDLVNGEDTRFAAVSKRPGIRLSRAVLAYHGSSDVDPESFEDDADMLCGLSTLHGLAHLVLQEKAAHFFRKANSPEFRQRVPPKTDRAFYPDPRAQI